LSARTLWIGLDVGADQMAACATDEKGLVLLEEVLPTKASAFDEYFKRHKRRIKLIGLESGDHGIPLTRSLRKMGYRVAVFDARQASKFLAIRRNKTDRNDARGLADIARIGQDSVSEVLVKSPECQRLRSMLVTRQKLVQLRVSTEGALRSLFRLNGGRLKHSHSAAALRKNVAGELKRLPKLARINLSKDAQPLLALSEGLRLYLEDMDRTLSRMAEENPVCQRFLKITGVGPLCALSFYSAVEDPSRFRRNENIGPYFGMVPLVRQSGNTCTSLKISKRGDSLTRSYLATAALVHMRFSTSALSQWGNGLSERTGKRRAQIAVARKLAVIMIAMWKSNAPYDPTRGLADKEIARAIVSEAVAA
jgi:transposase